MPDHTPDSGAYSSRYMDAKARYRQRLKLQTALARVLELMVHHRNAGITPDRLTGLMAGQVIKVLLPFGKAAGLTESETIPDRTDLSRTLRLIKSRKKETAARNRRAAKRTRR